MSLGVFLLVLAPAVNCLVAPNLIKAPLEIPQKYIYIIARGDGFNYFDPHQGKLVLVTVNVTRTIIGDVARHSGDSKVAVYDESLCLTRDTDGSHPGCVSKDDPQHSAHH